jgi:hypothetical protein
MVRQRPEWSYLRSMLPPPPPSADGSLVTGYGSPEELHEALLLRLSDADWRREYGRHVEAGHPSGNSLFDADRARIEAEGWPDDAEDL